MQAPFFTTTGEAKGQVDLPELLFGGAGSRYVLHETVRALRNNQRRGTSATKTRGLVSGGGRKPWKQKGTGNARAGSIRSPLWRKGGIIFGPMPRSYRIELNAAKKLLGLQTALVEKANSSQLSVLENLDLKDVKTSKAAAFLEKTGLKGNVLLVVDKRTPETDRAFRNLCNVTLLEAGSLNAWGVMQAQQLLLTKGALDALSNRLPRVRQAPDRHVSDASQES